MDVLPAHLNRDSLRDSFKGLVALEIIIDLLIGFPINNIISLNGAEHRYLVCTDSKFWIRSPEVTEEPCVKFNTNPQWPGEITGDCVTLTREIMLFIGKPKGRSIMISNATNPLKESRKNLY